MAVTVPVLLFMGVLAAAVSWLGLFQRFGDLYTPVLLQFLGAFFWGAFGMSSYNVTLSTRLCCAVRDSILPLVYLGNGLAILMALFAISELLSALGSEASATEEDLDI